MTDAPPWAQRPRESGPAFEAFCLYRDAGPGRRSVTEVARRLNKSRTLIGRWSTQHQWVRRCGEFDADQDRRLREELHAEKLKARQLQARIAKAALTKLAQRLGTLDPAEFRAQDIGRLTWDLSRTQLAALDDIGDPAGDPAAQSIVAALNQMIDAKESNP